jgi:hypothetical protein
MLYRSKTVGVSRSLHRAARFLPRWVDGWCMARNHSCAPRACNVSLLDSFDRSCLYARETYLNAFLTRSYDRSRFRPRHAPDTYEVVTFALRLVARYLPDSHVRARQHVYSTLSCFESWPRKKVHESVEGRGKAVRSLLHLLAAYLRLCYQILACYEHLLCL